MCPLATMQTSLHHSARMLHRFGVLLQLSPKWNDTGDERISQLRLHFSARWRVCQYFKAHPNVLWGKIYLILQSCSCPMNGLPTALISTPSIMVFGPYLRSLRCENRWWWALVRLIRGRMSWHQTVGSRHWLIYQVCESLHSS